jgi:hypothetical protein
VALPSASTTPLKTTLSFTSERKLANFYERSAKQLLRQCEIWTGFRLTKRLAHLCGNPQEKLNADEFEMMRAHGTRITG